jgi:hypothetical protein
LPDSRLISGLVFYRRVQRKETGMGSLIEELRRREDAARAEADRLRSRIEELSGDLARAEEQASRLAIAREEVTRVMDEPAAADPPAGQNGRPARPARPAGKGGPVSRIGAVTVPPWQEGSDASVLPRVHQDLLEVAADAGRPLRAVQFAAAAGLDTKKAKVEGLRSRLKLLAARGWLAEAPGGMFTLPDHSGKTPKPGR